MAERTDLIDALADLLAGLQVPLSIGLPLGKAEAPYRQILDSLPGFGWRDADQFRAELASMLANPREAI